jgi:hypothetical protein
MLTSERLAERIFFLGGPIVTLEDGQPSAQAWPWRRAGSSGWVI